MHELGYAHLDIKPQNILIDQNLNFKLADFGTAEFDERGNGLTKWRKGTDSYMAPEIKSRSIKAYNMYKADIYSLGVTLYTMLMVDFPRKHREFDNYYINTKETEDDSNSDSSDSKE